ncbi:antibiotic biosynthesis monooxygenase [Mucilaginibacter psychrotolerans]|uniref:Antibiotic biosynthesis monooxygenase n=1 Tax=Mucilaginibacter psychrotolerans TaxID=1524096 RepID=A0A4Y8S2S0_9SPHI|nr:antibiotic biosynthesis monooxygenase [Mucilaginibacter psychrotolerans]TFF33328.1 antibiotic biosynthesis monooxygenase [Mucilaginibacter psychrotolerans]
MPIHVAITRKVLPGKEHEFKDALHQFMGESFRHDGVHGASIISGPEGDDDREIGILRTFKNKAERDAFYHSEHFKKWEEYASKITEQPIYCELNGLEAFFRSAAAPPRWKMALVTLCGVFPTSILLNLAISPFVKDFPLFIRLLIIAVCMVGILTWVVMPTLTRVLKKWLRS